MTKLFERDGIRFRYPPRWLIETETTEEGWTTSLQSEGTALVFVGYYPNEEEPTVLADTALEGLREEYPSLEADDIVATLAGRPAMGSDAYFAHLDLTNTCRIRAVLAHAGSLLVMTQCCDEEWESFGAALDGVLESVEIDDD